MQGAGIGEERPRGQLPASLSLFQNQKFSKNEGRHALPLICSPVARIHWILETKAGSELVSTAEVGPTGNIGCLNYCYSSVVKRVSSMASSGRFSQMQDPRSSLDIQNQNRRSL